MDDLTLTQIEKNLPAPGAEPLEAALAETQALLETTRAELAEARKALDDLRGLMYEQIGASEVVGMSASGGAMEISIRPPHWALAAMVDSFAESLGDAPNWRTLEIGPFDWKGGRSIVATLRWKDGKTPSETARDLHESLSLMLGHVRRLQAGEPLGLAGLKDFARAAALVRASEPDRGPKAEGGEDETAI